MHLEFQNTSQNSKHVSEFKNTCQSLKHVPESKNTCQNPKHVPESKNTCQNPKQVLAWDNSWHFATPPLVSPPNDVREMSAEIPYWWRVTTQIWVVLLIGRAVWEIWFHQSEALARFGKWRVISMEFVRSFLRRHFAGKPVVVSRTVGCFLRLNTTQNPKNIRDAFGFLDVVLVLGKCFWVLRRVLDSGEVFLDSGTCFGFCEVFLDSGKCFWILGRVLDSGKCFWILWRVLDFGKCFEPPLLLALITPHPDQRCQNIFSLIYKNVTIPYVLYLLEKWFATYFELALSTKLCTTSLFRVRLVIG